MAEVIDPFAVAGEEPPAVRKNGEALEDPFVRADLEVSPFPDKDPDPGFFSSITGSDRETRATRELPSLAEFGVFNFLGDDVSDAKKFAVASALLTTFDEDEAIQILQDATMGEKESRLKVAFDPAGNRILSHNGNVVMFNKPGADAMDVMQVGGTIAAFTPGARVTSTGAKGIGSAALREGVTQSGIETLQASQGGEFSVGDVAFAAGGAVFAQGLFQSLAKRFPIFRETGNITDDMREIVREEAVKLGIPVEEITDDFIRQGLDRARTSVNPAQATAVAGEAEFGIPLTAGQRSLDDAALSQEDQLRVGLGGESGQRILRDFEQTQVSAVDAARDRIAEGIEAPAGSAGAVIKDAIRAAEADADEAIIDAYANVGKASLSPEGVQSLLGATRRAVSGVEFDRTLPETAKMLGLVSETAKAQKQMRGGRGQHIKVLENWRRRLGTAINATDNPSDKRQLVAMKAAYDTYIDQAVVQGLFSGDAAAINQLKTSRALFAEYAKKFRANPKRTKSGRNIPDREGQFIDQIISADPTDEQVLNTLFGANVFSRGAGRDMAQRMRAIVGDDSDAWKAIRQAGFDRLIQSTTTNGQRVISGAKTQKAIADALAKNGSLMRELYSADEIALFRRFADQVQRTQPQLVRSRENPSGTGQTALKALAETARRVTSVLGLVEPGLALTSAGVQSVRRGGKAREAVRPFRDVIRPKPGFTAGGATAGVVLGPQAVAETVDAIGGDEGEAPDN